MGEPYYSDDSVTVHAGDCLDVMREIPDDSVDSVCTDPPYGLTDIPTSKVEHALHYWMSGCRDWAPSGAGFMARGWDAFVPPPAVWDECFRVLKPGGHLLAFAGSRTQDLMALSIRLADFEIRDSVAWIHGQGFPKSSNHLKPAFEPIVVARKPVSGTVAQNVTQYGTGALDIDGCRTPVNPSDINIRERDSRGGTARSIGGGEIYSGGTVGRDAILQHPGGRWPTNVVLDEAAAAELDRQSGFSRSSTTSSRGAGGQHGVTHPRGAQPGKVWTPGDQGGASRFFPVFKYAAKAGSDERPEMDGVRHPTVKPLDLMRWLVRLVTPPGGAVLDPFAGSGTTGEAAVLEHMHAILIEREPDYLPLIVQRLSKPMEIGFDFDEEAS